MGRRSLLLIAAFVVAAIGAAFIFLYVQGVDDRALAGQQPVQVLVVKTTIPAGTTGAQAVSSGALQIKKIARDAAAPGALSEVEPIRGLVALAPLFPGEQLLRAKFGAGAAASSGLPIPSGLLAVSVQLGDPARVAGFVQPGAEVAVFVTLSPTGGTGGAGGTGGSAGAASSDSTRLLLERVPVLATGPTTLVSQTRTNEQTGESNTEQIPKAILTLGLPQEKAQRLIYAQGHGQLYFALLTKDSKLSTDTVVNAKTITG